MIATEIREEVPRNTQPATARRLPGGGGGGLRAGAGSPRAFYRVFARGPVPDDSGLARGGRGLHGFQHRRKWCIFDAAV